MPSTVMNRPMGGFSRSVLSVRYCVSIPEGVQDRPEAIMFETSMNAVLPIAAVATGEFRVSGVIFLDQSNLCEHAVERSEYRPMLRRTILQALKRR